MIEGFAHRYAEHIGVLNFTNPQDVSNGNIAYWRLRPFWTSVLELREPLPETISQYLDRYPNEDDDEFGRRASRVAQINMVDIILDAYIAMLFSVEVQVKAAKHQDKVDQFTNCCNHLGQSLKDYFRELAVPTSLQFSHCDIVVDTPDRPKDADPLSADAEQKLGLNIPYCYVIQPLNRYAWQVDKFGNFTEYRSDNYLDTQIQASLGFLGGSTVDKQYTVWTEQDVTEYDAKFQAIDTTPNPFGFIPIVTLIPIPSVRYQGKRLGKSLVQDVVAIQRRILNTMSLIYDFQENVNYGTKVIIQDSDSDNPIEEGEVDEAISGNKRGVVLYGEGSDYKIVTPDPAGVREMMNYLDCLIERAYQSVSIQSDSNTNKTHQTSSTIRQNSHVLLMKLTNISKHIENAMKQVIDMALRVQGLDPIEAGVTVTWGTNFAYESLTNSLEQCSLLRSVASDISPTLVSELLNKATMPEMYNSLKIDDIENESNKWIDKQNKMLAQPPVMPTLQQDNTQVNAADKVSDQE